MPERPPVPAHLRFQADAANLRRLSLRERFERIYETNLWGSEESRSGSGSTGDQTAELRAALPALLRDLGARSLLDIPCGDFGWMRHVDLDGVEYTGADIVPALIAAHQERYAGPSRRFAVLDLTRDALPSVDVVFCRDCLVHLSFANIRAALENVQRSGSRYLLTTTFTEHDSNEDSIDGDWRLLNLERPPFSLPPPQRLVYEDCTESDGAYRDKALGLWPVHTFFTIP